MRRKSVVSPSLLARPVFFRVLAEYDIEQLQIHKRTRILRHYDPDRFTTIAPANITDWGKGNHDIQWRTLETMIFALRFPPTTQAFDRFFELLQREFDQEIPALAQRKWNEDRMDAEQN